MSTRYAILQHQLNEVESHFDLLFETTPGLSLATWRSPAWPIDEPTEVLRIKDHRRIFLDFEGELDGGRGYVTRVAGGDCDVVVGEGNLWTVRLLNGTAPAALVLRPINAEAWVAETIPLLPPEQAAR